MGARQDGGVWPPTAPGLGVPLHPAQWTDTARSEVLRAARESVMRVLCVWLVMCGELGEEAVVAPLWCRTVHGAVTLQLWCPPVPEAGPRGPFVPLEWAAPLHSGAGMAVGGAGLCADWDPTRQGDS